jgi:hypothetical protein
LKFAKSYGYGIKVIKGYSFNRIKSVFNDYIFDLFKKKSESQKGSQKLIAKSLLNNLIGRFGLSIIKPISKVVDLKERDYILSTRVVNSQKLISDTKVLITYEPFIDRNICEINNYDFIKVLEKEKNINLDKNLDLFKDVSIASSAMVTGYARIIMNKYKINIIENKGNIYYSDTDSIVTDFIKKD